ncbi:MAG: hypothetical protein GDA66_01905 [Nitrospira sp. CR1.2]|nr:hypothetical protein [Nitrospira sp. CR1.2]
MYRVHVQGIAGLLILCAHLFHPSTGHAQPVGSDVFSTQGAYDRFAVGNAHRWFDKHTTEARQKSSHCLSILNEAKALQDTALALDEQARQPGIDSRQATALRKQANEQFGVRSQKIRAFIDCFNQANRQKSPQSDRFATGGDSQPHDGGTNQHDKKPSPPPSARKDKGQKQGPGSTPKPGINDQRKPSDVFSTKGDKTPSDDIQTQTPSDQSYGSGSDEIRTGQNQKPRTLPDIFKTMPGGRPPGDVFGTDSQHHPKPDRKPNRVFIDTEPREKIWNLQQLAVWVFKNYQSSVGPIATVPIKNATQPTYLMLLSGLDLFKLGRATSTLADARMAFTNITVGDAYWDAILVAAKSLPHNANLVIAGHSLGGMEAQKVVARLRKEGFHVQQVITYGSPITALRDGTTQYRYITAEGDQIANIYQLQENNPAIVRIPGGTDPLPFSPKSSHQIYPWSLQLTYRTVPKVANITAPCWELDIHRVVEYSAPDLASRILRLPSGDYRSARRICPRNPGFNDLHCGCQRASDGSHKSSNCFWASLAEDYTQETGGRIQYWAPCEPQGTQEAVISDALLLHYGRNNQQVVRGRQEIEEALRNPGSRGLVFFTGLQRIQSTDNTAPREPGATYRILNGRVFKEEPGEQYREIGGELFKQIRHVFNARNNGTRVIFYDAQSSSPEIECDASGYFDMRTVEIKLFQTKFTAPPGQYHSQPTSLSH